MYRRKLFKYDILKLIDLVEKRPLIWDKTHKHHKHKIKKQRAWREVYRGLDNNYDKADEKQQTETGDAITTKWIYLRDAFNKSLRTSGGEGPRKKYIYFDHLEFLLKNGDMGLLDFSQSIPEATTPQPKGDDETPSDCQDENRTITTSSTQSLKRKIDTIEKDLRVKQETDEDDAFFQSVKPSVMRMSEDDKYEFRMGVMRLIQQIRKRRQNASPPPSTLPEVSHLSSSGPAQALIKQYAPDNSADDETGNQSGAEQYNYMLLPINKTEGDEADIAEEVFDDFDESEV